MKEKEDDRTFEAAIHGVDLRKAKEKSKKEDLLFKDPKDYEKLSKEERKRLTEEMKKRFEGQFGRALPIVKTKRGKKRG